MTNSIVDIFIAIGFIEGNITAGVYNPMLEQRTFDITFQIIEVDFSVLDDSPCQGASETKIKSEGVVETCDTLELAQTSLKTTLGGYLKDEWWSESEHDKLDRLEDDLKDYKDIVEGKVIRDDWHHITRAVFIKKIERELSEERKILEATTA